MKILSTFAFVSMLSISFATEAKMTVDTAASTFQWHGSKKAGSGHTGKIKLKEATLSEKDGKIVSGKFVIDMKTITVEDLEGEWAEKFLGHIATDDFFLVNDFPTATLDIKESSNDNTIKGKLTVKGVTQPISVKYKKEGNTYSGTLIFDRTKFGVKYGSGSLFKSLTADKIINDEVKIDFKVVSKS